MSGTPGPSGENGKVVSQGVILGAVVGQVGCLTLIIVLAALFGGLWLDEQFGTKPFVTVTLLLISVPVTIVALLWIVRMATRRLQGISKSKDPKIG